MCILYMELHVITNGDRIRKNNVSKSLDTYSIPFIFHEFERQKNGKLGCFMSHINLYRYAQKHNMEYIWIAEDNLVNAYDTISSVIWNDIHTFLKTEQNWLILFFGGWFQHVVSYKSTSYSSIFKTNTLHGTSCYMIHKRLYSYVLDHFENYSHMDIDCYLLKCSKNQAYILYPILFYRDCTIYSTNTQHIPNTWINLWRSFWHQPTMLQIQENLIRNGYMTYSFNIFLISVLLCIILFICYGLYKGIRYFL
jgi:GR25 family glycosyltransferase involved in LPS biosynthesis